MDCIEAREKINLFVDDLLDDAEKQRLIWHASMCPQCKQALDDAVRLKQALAGLKDVEPPAGLAAVAVIRAKKRRIPVFAYATAAAAAVIALAFVFSPQLLRGNDLTGEGAEEKLMYATVADSARGESFAMDGAEDAQEAPQAESTLAMGAPLSSAAVEDEAAANRAPCFFDSEAELCDAIRSGSAAGLTYYYRPAALPEGAALQHIEVSDYSVRLVYSLADGSMLTFEWLRTWTADDLKGWSDDTLLRSDNLAHSFDQSGAYFWSPEGRFSETGEMEFTDGTTINAYWTQDGAAFHAELPLSFTEEYIVAYCVANQVQVE